MAKTNWHQVNIRLNDAEYQLAKLQADRAGMTIYQYAKAMTMKGRVRPPKPPVIAPELGKEILTQISKIGTNVNQLAKKANSGDIVGIDEITAVNHQLASLLDYISSGKRPVKSDEQRLEEKGQEALIFPTTDDEESNPEAVRWVKSHGIHQDINNEKSNSSIAVR